ncbi:DEAD/DEAH box helicase [Paraburkholderia nemoris]|uniref:DEAD/DEAH box helicase n=1 Tax=Paraburkholderia nemoris TaxID=2793076 RepID=UPI001B23EDD1|nr:helicase C-terminal domain-containing protein [Paraburkholderia nemoris]CAE6773720.1 RNA polymerase-associated protein RapA [Paraburkholderia nemoris]
MSSKQELIVGSFDRLTDFQKATVKAVVQRFEEDQQPRVLVADEVGLGKTVVARGVIAQMLLRYLATHGDTPARPLRVTYICSNQTLAEENRRKLAIFSGKAADDFVQSPTFWRLAELGVRRDQAQSGKLIEICTLTPATSFGGKRRGKGNAHERYILFRALAEHPLLAGTDLFALEAFFQQGVKGWWPGAEGWPGPGGIVPSVLEAFHASLEQAVTLPQVAQDALHQERIGCANWINLLRDSAALYARDQEACTAAFNRIRTELRSRFVRACAGNLEADLFILDEFQRFKELLGRESESEEGIIAHKVFENARPGAGKVLLLSATPFKALTHIDDEENAHAEQLRFLLRFIVNGDESRLDAYEQARETLLKEILRLRDESLQPADLSTQPKDNVEAVLRRYICRTERASIGSGVENVTDANHLACTQTFNRAEIDAFIAFDKVGQALRVAQPAISHMPVMEFYKAAPWPLSFLGDYKMRDHIDALRDIPSVKAALSKATAAWIPADALKQYKLMVAEKAPNAKVRELTRTVLGNDAEMLLWVPPSRPYYALEGPFAANPQFSKTLLFSGLLLAPRALSGLISYEVERRLVRAAKDSQVTYFGDPRDTTIIRFDDSKRLAPWALVYPSTTLRKLTPLRDLAAQTRSAELVAATMQRLTSDLERLERFNRSERTQKDLWYALAPMLLDLTDHSTEEGRDDALSPHDTCRRWLDECGCAELREQLNNVDLDLGPMPEELPEFLSKLAIAGPGISLLSSLERVWGKDDRTLARRASEGAIDFIQLFNNPEGKRILKVTGRETRAPYWKAALDYCVAGNLQAMFDEYLHMLHSGGLVIDDAMARIKDASRLRAGSVTAQVQRSNGNALRLRCHFAVAISNQNTSDQDAIDRISNVRDAFNSPFWPFMLNSTSIGQEGLDFHWYCSRVVHWSLPSNPIDLEQREGRVNRYKSLLVRRRVAEYVGGTQAVSDGGDMWAAWFEQAKSARSLAGDARSSDLVPFWHMPTGKARIERLVPFMPMSREEARLTEMLKILSLYRLAFGQPRQQELLENLLVREFDEDGIEEVRRKLMIDLAPLNYASNTSSAPIEVAVANTEIKVDMVLGVGEAGESAPLAPPPPVAEDQHHSAGVVPL